jgi:hypothetical protein
LNNYIHAHRMGEMNRSIRLCIVVILVTPTLGLFSMERSLDQSLDLLSKSLIDLKITLETPSKKTVDLTSLNFTIATCNVLFHPYYQTYFKGDKKNPQEFVAIATRLEAFEASLQNPHALGNLDIICFQEWDYTNVAWETLLKKYYPDLDYWHIKDKKATHDGVYTVINRSKFSYMYKGDPFVRNLKKESTKEFCWILLEIIEPSFKKTPSAMLGIINAHLPHASFDPIDFKHSLQQIVQKYSEHISAGWIVCGDFNFNILDVNNDYKNLQLYFNSAMWTSSFEQEQSNPSATSYANGAQYNDYIFYKKRHLNLVNIFHFPIGVTDLIKHTPAKKGDGPWYSKTYFSDHAIVRATFEITP